MWQNMEHKLQAEGNILQTQTHFGISIYWLVFLLLVESCKEKNEIEIKQQGFIL